MDAQDVPGWPAGVRRITVDDLGEIGVDQAGELYFSGKKLVTEKRFSDFERGLAVAGLIIAGVGVAATVVQAWASLAALQVGAA